MRLEKVSILTGKSSVMELPITLADLARVINGEKVQDVVPHLSDDEREFLISGITTDGWDELLGNPDVD